MTKLEVIRLLSRRSAGVTSADLAAEGVEDPVAAIQQLANEGHSLRWRFEPDGVTRRWWFASTAPHNAPIVKPSRLTMSLADLLGRPEGVSRLELMIDHQILKPYSRVQELVDDGAKVCFVDAAGDRRWWTSEHAPDGARMVEPRQTKDAA